MVARLVPRSTGRMAGRVTRRTQVLIGAGVTGLVVVAGPGAHAAAERRPPTVVEARYPCQMAMKDLEFLAIPVEITVRVTLDLAARIGGASRVVPSGELALTLPTDRRPLFALTASSLTATSSMVRLDATAQGTTTSLPTTWASRETPTSATDLTLSGPIEFPGFTAPESGGISLALTTAEDQASILGAAPVALNLELTGSGYLGPTTYFISCAAPRRDAASPARIDVVATDGSAPIAPPIAPPASTPITPGPAPAGAPTGFAAAPPVDLAPRPAVSAPPPAASVAPVTVAAAPVLDLADWTVPVDEPADGVTLPPRLLGLLTLLLVLLALASALWSELRLRSLRAAARLRE